MKILKYLILSLVLTACGTDDSHKWSCTTAGEECGVRGDKGEPGDPGEPGIQGVSGPAGKTGSNGKEGLNGSNGQDGKAGTDGVNGKDGTNGVDGINGVNGSNGADGINGTNGSSGVDGVNGTNGTNGSNGTNGTNGQDGAQGPTGPAGQDAVLSSGHVGPWVPTKVYSACHHDYLYLSNGWLLFRHQANGTGDQGVGTTGFDTWNVDIADFALVSEVGNHLYCTLHFNKNALTLTGVVNDTADGLAGTQININL